MTSIGVVAHTKKELGGGADGLRVLLAEAGMADVPWRGIDRSKQAPAQVRRLLADGVDRLLVWGGDGTVRRCIHTIVGEGSGAELAVLPAGTANLLAHELGIPIDLEAAVQVALHGAVRSIDVGVINGECFAVMAGAGFDALLIRDADEAKDRVGRLAYLKAGVKHLSTSPMNVKVKIDGNRWFAGEASCVLVGNMGHVLGGIAVFPEAHCDDGVLDVGVLTAQSKLDWLRLGARMAAGRIDASPLVQLAQGGKVTIRLGRPRVWELDGGDRPKVDKLTVSVLPRRVPICVPTP